MGLHYLAATIIFALAFAGLFVAWITAGQINPTLVEQRRGTILRSVVAILLWLGALMLLLGFVSDPA